MTTKYKWKFGVRGSWKRLFIFRRKKMQKVIEALKLAQNQIASSREMCDEEEGEVWDQYQEAIEEAEETSKLLKKWFLK